MGAVLTKGQAGSLVGRREGTDWAESTGRAGRGCSLTPTPGHANCACGHHQSSPAPVPAPTQAAGSTGCAQPVGRVCSPLSTSLLTHSQMQRAGISKLNPSDTHRHVGMFHRANVEPGWEHRVPALTLLLHRHSQDSQENPPVSHWPQRLYHLLVWGGCKVWIILLFTAFAHLFPHPL